MKTMNYPKKQKQKQIPFTMATNINKIPRHKFNKRCERVVHLKL